MRKKMGEEYWAGLCYLAVCICVCAARIIVCGKFCLVHLRYQDFRGAYGVLFVNTGFRVSSKSSTDQFNCQLTNKLIN